MKDFKDMVKSGAPFARKFPKDDPVLDKIDHELLGRFDGGFTPGAWCVGREGSGEDPCLTRGNVSSFRPGPGAKRLRAAPAIYVIISQTIAAVQSMEERYCKLIQLQHIRSFH
ncbi:hypothetical protein HPP92_028157 [Vanilla planifolia]|uniref:Uncharacterized protein n=1 Tax=Vanilla planifolia TaxID=51239 RepID=A0A835P8E0_VANPL|nr:hypothetical protein HPP92_028157 [Vanilla planifolia]